ncbi:transcription factor SPT20 homolog isoform X2 [Xenia sp. Carnegie-2017]|nr:transcription factor SPT20 homolog isoform X2 [Xenia sp. Carnegie-2017]
MLKSASGTEAETVRLPYEETEFLDYLDAQQLPPMLVDLLEKSKVNIFYDGCVIVEVRDYRCCVNPGSYDTSYVLLRPTCQTLLADVNALTQNGDWTYEDKLKLEADLLLKTQSPLCLDPSTEVFKILNKMHFNRNKYRTTLLQRSFKRRFRSYISQNRSSLPVPSCLKLVDFLAHHKHTQPPVNLRLSKSSYNGVDTWKQRTLSLPPPSEAIQVMKFSKKVEASKLDSNSAPETVQEIVLEAEKSENHNYHCRVTIQRRPADLQYLGELSLHEDAATKEITQNKEKCCKFFLGSKLSAQRYLQQFQDLYTEEGRKSVKISSYIPTQQQAMIQAQNKNKIKAEPSRTPSPCQAQKTENKAMGTTVKTSNLTNTGNKMASNVIAHSGSSQSISGKIPIYNTTGSTGSIVMSNTSHSGMTVQGKQYVTAIPVPSSSVQNQQDLQPTVSYQHNVAYVQPKVVALGNTAIPVVTTPIAPNTNKTNPGTRPSILQPKFITTSNVKNCTQTIQPATPGAITLIQSTGSDSARRLLPSSIASRLFKKQSHNNVTIQGQPVQIARSNTATIALSNAGILTQLGIGSAQLSAQKVTPQQALSSSLTQLQPQTRQPTSASANTSTAVTMVTLSNTASPIPIMTSTGNRSTSNRAPVVPLQPPIQVRMVQFPQGSPALQQHQITLQSQVNASQNTVTRTPGRPNLRRRPSHQSNTPNK